MVKPPEDSFKKVYCILLDLLKINKEHKNITKKLYKNSMTKNEQRIWNGLTIFLMIIGMLIGGGIYYVISLGENSSEDILIQVSPERIILNEGANINFEINFTNVGNKDLNDFDILKIDLYRDEGGKLTFKRQIKTPFDNKDYSISCRNGWVEDNEANLKIGDTCTVKVDMYSCPACFDDKDKEIYLLIFFNSVPPIKNAKVKISIF